MRVSLIKSNDDKITFPYTPNVSVGATVSYSDYDVVHTNYPINAFQKSRPNNIIISAPLYNQDQDEVKTTMQILNFLAVNSKMEFGTTGAPPPILRFVGPNKFAGSYVPVVIVSYNISYPNEPDYVTIDNENYFPTEMTVNVELSPQYSASAQAGFDINSFSEGTLYSGGYI